MNRLSAGQEEIVARLNRGLIDSSKSIGAS